MYYILPEDGSLGGPLVDRFSRVIGISTLGVDPTPAQASLSRSASTSPHDGGGAAPIAPPGGSAEKHVVTAAYSFEGDDGSSAAWYTGGDSGHAAAIAGGGYQLMLQTPGAT